MQPSDDGEFGMVAVVMMMKNGDDDNDGGGNDDSDDVCFCKLGLWLTE